MRFVLLGVLLALVVSPSSLRAEALDPFEGLNAIETGASSASAGIDPASLPSWDALAPSSRAVAELRTVLDDAGFEGLNPATRSSYAELPAAAQARMVAALRSGAGRLAVDPGATGDARTFARDVAGALEGVGTTEGDLAAAFPAVLVWLDGFPGAELPDAEAATGDEMPSGGFLSRLIGATQRQLAEHTAKILAKLTPPSRGVVSSREHPSKDPFTFPRDHGAHPSVCEWWYWNGHFGTTPGSPSYGFELCFFKALEGVFVCHVAVTDEAGQTFEYQRFYSLPIDGRAKKGGLDLRCRMRDLAITRPDLVSWAKGLDASATNDHAHAVHGEVGSYVFDFDLASTGKAPLPINGDGIIDMPEGGDSWYYSLTRLALTGTLKVKGADGKLVTKKVTGQAWMDHQWGQFIVLKRGWDWYSFQMEDGSEYNLFAMRKDLSLLGRYGVPSAATFGNSVDARGVRRAIGGLATPHHVEVRPLEFWKGRTGIYATSWEVVVRPWNESFLVRARVKDQEVGAKAPDPLPTYWEGSCDVWRRDADGTLVRGLAYIEHMPYPTSLKVQKPLGDWSGVR